MKLDCQLVNDQVHLTMEPDDDFDMELFGRYFPQAEVAGAQGASTVTLEIVKIAIGRAEFRRRLKPLGLVESGRAGTLKVSSTADTADAKFRCMRLDPRRDPTECQNLAASDYREAVFACEMLAAANNWFGGRPEEGACQISGS